MNWKLETALTMMAVAAMCAVPGTLLVLRRMVMIGDAISHVLLLGIVLAYFVVRDLASPWLMIGAALSGVATVALVELLQKSRRIKEDAAIGLIFTALFSIGTILVSLKMKGIHLDVDRVLMGQGLTVTLDSVSILGVTLPRALAVACILFSINLILLVVLWKELKLALFDAGLAATLGFSPVFIHYGLMTSVSLTTVAAFDAVGPVLVLAFFAVPAVTARLLTDRFAMLILLSVLISIVAAALGSWLTFALNTTIAGTITGMLGVIFAVVFLIAPERGLIAQSLRRYRQRRSFHETMLLVHLLSHEDTDAEADEASEIRLPHHLSWTATNVNALAARVQSQGLITNENRLWRLTEAGRDRARASLRMPGFDV